jgi:precorrin-3B methylase
VIASATPDRTPVTADFQKAAAAAKAKTPYEAIDNAIAQQETITVSDSDHPLYGRSGLATERQGLAVKIEVEPGKTTALLVNQIAVGSEVLHLSRRSRLCQSSSTPILLKACRVLMMWQRCGCLPLLAI